MLAVNLAFVSPQTLRACIGGCCRSAERSKAQTALRRTVRKPLEAEMHLVK